MQRFTIYLILFILLVSCGSDPQKKGKPAALKAATSQDTVSSPKSPSEPCMWKVSSYAGNLGDNKNSSYITNAFAIWGSYSSGGATQGELKVKFLIDKVSFCIKLYEQGNKIVKKGDESNYKVTVKPANGEQVQIVTRNVSDRIFFNDTDSRQLATLFDQGGKISFILTTDSKTNPATYTFVLDHPEGFGSLLKSLSK